MRWVLGIAASLAATFAAAPVAAEQPSSPAYRQCLDRSGAVDVEMARCAWAEAERQDAVLNRVYRQLSAKLAAQHRVKLIAAERAWIAYRDAECVFEVSGAGGGTAERLIAANCRLEMINERISDLQQRLEREG